MLIEIFQNIFTKILPKYWQLFLFKGLGYTLLLSLITVFFGSILGALLAMLKMSKIPPFRWIVNIFVEIIRGTPLLLQLYVGYFLVPVMIPALASDKMVSVSVALVLNSAAYVTEIIRSGIQAVDKGQTEAARSLGLSQGQTMAKVILPQAIKNILPALGNEFVAVIKETSLASTFYIGDLMTQYLVVKGNTFLAIECLFIVGVIYFVVTFALSRAVGAFERRLKKGE